MSEYLAICEEAARAGGRTLLDWVGRFKVREKGPADFVTEADLASQEAVRRVILDAFPGHAIVGEEGGDQFDPAMEFCWIIDPLDGTTNYVHRVDHYAVSVALVQRGRPLVGVVLDPVHNECFAAARGQGVWLNREPIRTSGVDELAEALAAASFAARVPPDSPEIDQFNAALLNCQAVRRTGSAALNLAYVACGRFDVFWALSTKSWDVAAGVLLVEEAGGAVSGPNGGPLDLNVAHPVTAATPTLHAAFLKLLKQSVRHR